MSNQIYIVQTNDDLNNINASGVWTRDVRLQGKNVEGILVNFYEKIKSMNNLQVTDEINLAVKDAVDDSIAGLESNMAEIKMSAGKINLLVKSSDASGNIELTDKLLEAIVDNVKITASDIQLEGTTTVNGKVSIGLDGTLHAEDGEFSGTITGSNITGSSIVGGTFKNSASNPSFQVAADGTCTASKMNITGGKIDVGASTFTIRSAHLYVENGDITINNNKGYRAKDSSGNTVTLAVFNEQDQIRFGWGSWDAHSVGAYDQGVEYMGGARTVLRGRDQTFLVCNSGTYNSTGGSAIVFFNNGTDYVFRPVAPGKTTCGTKAYPWLNIYGNAITNLSDRTTKENIKYITDTSLCNDDVETENNITIQDMYKFVRDDCALATYNYINDKHKTPKLNFIANDVIVNMDGSDNKVGQLIVNPKVDDAEGGLLGYDLGNYISVIGGALQGAIRKIETLEEEVKSLKEKLTKEEE